MAEDQILIKVWPANSYDLNPVDYRVWGKLQERVYHNCTCDADQLKSRLIGEWEQFQQSVINEAAKQWRQHLQACIRARGGHFEHKLQAGLLFDISSVTQFNS